MTGDQFLTDVVHLAAALLGVPAATLTLVDGGAPRVVARVEPPSGEIDDEVLRARVVDSNAPHVVTDLEGNGNGAIRSYAGVPLRRDADVCGVLAVMDHVARPDAAGALPHLERLARLAEARLVRERQAGEPSTSDDEADAGLRPLMRHLEAAQRIAAVGSWENRLRRNRITWSDEIYRIFGITRDDFGATFDAFVERIHPDDRAAMQAAHEATVAGQGPLDIEHRIVRPDGTVRYVRERGELFLEGDEPVLAGTVQDITDRVRAEEQLRESEERFREMAETIEDVFWVWDAQARHIAYASPSYETVFGTSRDDLYTDATSFQRYIDPEDLPRVLAAVRDNPTHMHLEYRVIRPDGDRRWIDARTFPVRDAEGRMLRSIGIARDVTRLRQAEQALLRAQRLESIGTLAGGIAHDINNVLTPIVMAAGVLATTARDDGEADLLATIIASAERGAGMVRQVLAFARGVEGRLAPLRVEHVVADIGKLIRDTFDRSITLNVVTSPDLRSVMGDATQLHQVLLNLAVNARDAMPGGGRLTLRAANVLVDRHTSGVPSSTPVGCYVALIVADTGTGIPPAIHHRVFDPFYTTKPQGHGTGLGLATVQTLVRGHGGFLTLDSAVGVGTTFTVYLPALDGAEPAAAATTMAAAARGDGRLILVVDDEDAVRMVTRTTLETFGYRVVVAEHGAAGVALFKARPDEFAGVVTDVMMPVMDGYALIDALRALRPSLPIVAASGLETPGMADRMARAGIHHFLAKPYSSDTLLQTLAAALAGP
jgi:PAS domain S-box-containing protein